MIKESNVRTKNKNIRKFLQKKSCLGKIKHKSILSAEYILNNMVGKNAHLLVIYKCAFCLSYHIGHDKKEV